MATKEKGISYFQHFPKNFLRPYGGAKIPTDGEIQKQLKNENCEWFGRPIVAASEFHATMSENLQNIKKTSVLDEKVISVLEDMVQPLIESSRPFDQISSSSSASMQDAQNFVKQFLKEDATDEYTVMQEIMLLGHSLFSVGLHYIVTYFLLNNPSFLAENMKTGNKKDKKFKDTEDLKYFCTLLVNEKERSSTSSNDRETLLR